MSDQTEPARIEILTAAANGNATALAFLMVFAERAHWLDDLVDEATKATAQQVAEAEERWIMCLATNTFFLTHRAALLPAMVLALNAWVHSEGVDNPVEQAVVKGQWHEVVWLVAWLTGGWMKLRDVSSTFRKYDVEEVPNERH